MKSDGPIGVFDSGVGGLTVLRELQRQLPDEELIYIADLAHFPYGPRRQDEVRGFALEITDHLVTLGAKLVVIACNTATAAALDAAREAFDVPVVGVIAPGAHAAIDATRNGRIAVLSTVGTHASQAYVHALRAVNPAVAVLSKAAPELVDIVEAGDADSQRAEVSLRAVLGEAFEWEADTLVLGCTHYPLLRRALGRVVGDRMRVVDSAETTAAMVGRVLSMNDLARPDGGPSIPRLMVTAQPDQFTAIAGRIFGEHIDEPDVIPLGHGLAPTTQRP